MQLFSIVYSSKASSPMSQESQLALYQHARKANVTREVTGLLLYRDGHFMQTLEGGQAEVELLFQRIAGDPRHHSVQVMFSGAVPVRSYPQWNMAYLAFSSGQEDNAYPATAPPQSIHQPLHAGLPTVRALMDQFRLHGPSESGLSD